MNMKFGRGVLAAIVICSMSLAVLAHGLFGLGSISSGLIFTVPVAALVLLGQWNPFVFDSCDALFLAFVALVALSLVVNGAPYPKEAFLLLISLACYPAARFSGVPIATKGFVGTIALIIAVGTIVTAEALIAQWDDPHGKPYVFGYDAATTSFTMAMCVLVIALANMNLTNRSTIAAGLAISIPATVFAASMVRFAFIALIASLALSAILGDKRARMRSLILIGITIASVAAGLTARHKTSSDFIGLAASTFSIERARAYQPPPEVSCKDLNPYNSIAIRQQLYVDGIKSLPGTGPFGRGLDAFLNLSCLRDYQVHNSILQVMIEFGIPAGIVLMILLALPVLRLRTLATADNEARFCICSLLFAVAVSLVHGRISRDFNLFLFLGYAASMRSLYLSRDPKGSESAIFRQTRVVKGNSA